MENDPVEIAELRKLLKPGDTVYTVLRHRSASGMSRVIDVFVIRKTEYGRKEYEPRRLAHMVARALGRTYDDRYEGVKSNGVGMDMGFELIYNLGRALFPNGFKLRKGEHGRNGDTSGFDKDGGYALNHKWL